MAIILPELPYAYDALWNHTSMRKQNIYHDKHTIKLMSTKPMHLEKHTLKSEDLEALLADVESISADIRQKHFNNGGTDTYHALFWEYWWLPRTQLPAELAAEIEATFLVFEEFQKQPSLQQQTLVLVQVGHGWLSTKKGNLKWLQQQTKTHQSQKVKNQSWAWTFGNMLTTWNTATCVLTTSKLSFQ